MESLGPESYTGKFYYLKIINANFTQYFTENRIRGNSFNSFYEVITVKEKLFKKL